MYGSTRKSLSQSNGDTNVGDKVKDGQILENPKDVYSEIADIFPALQKYKSEHNTANLQKLCVEISEFCRSVYASTENDKERQIYRMMIEKLNK